MTYRKVYPSELTFSSGCNQLSVNYPDNPKHSPDLWSIKYLFDKQNGETPAKAFLEGSISHTMALRMHFLKNLFPNVEFHDAVGDGFHAVAEDIIGNVGTRYVTYDKQSQCAVSERGVKQTPESRIEKVLADNLSAYLPEFPANAKVLRQFPANIFENSVSKRTRCTDKLWIDMVSLNSAGELAPIELKVGGNIPLDLFAQGLDYGIYCHLFKKHILDNWFDGRGGKGQHKTTVYYVGEAFHPALIGRDERKGILSLVQKNDLFNIVFVKIELSENRQTIAGTPEVIFDTRQS